MKRHHIAALFSAAALTVAALFVSCTDSSDDLGGDPLHNQISALEHACNEGRGVTSLTSADNGWHIEFADGSELDLPVSGSTDSESAMPIARAVNGSWCVSCDGGKLFSPISDAAGNTIPAQKYTLRAIVGGNGYFTFEVSQRTSSQTVEKSIATKYKPRTSAALHSAVLDDTAATAVLTLADGRELAFAYPGTHPNGITVLSDKVVLASHGQGEFSFRINPSDARFEPKITGADVNLQLKQSSTSSPQNCRLVSVATFADDNRTLYAGQYRVVLEDLGTADEYEESVYLELTTVNTSGETIRLLSGRINVISESLTFEPELLSVRIGDVTAVKTDDSVFHIKLPYGTNVKSLQPQFTTNGCQVYLKDGENGETAVDKVDFSMPVTFVAVSPTDKRREYKVVVHYSNLPVVYISTPTAITSKENWIKQCSIEIWNAGELNGTYAEVQMKGRGNSTWGYEKKPYAIKLDKKAEVLGMPKHKRWVLLANYLDITCLRNDVSFEIARRLPGLAWTPRGKFVDLVLNGRMVGNYYLCEQIKVDVNRVNITEIAPTDIGEYTKTGGYIFELDSYFDEAFKFKTKYFYNYYSDSSWKQGLPVQFKDPDEDIATAQFNYVQDYFNSIEEILLNGNPYKEDVFDYIDMDSFIDWWLVQELSHNKEPKHPKSSYMYKDRGGKLFAGPVWDFDYETYIPDNSGFIDADYMWYHALFQDSRFRARVKEKWAESKSTLYAIENYIDAGASRIHESAVYNMSLWPNGGFWDDKSSYDNAVARIKSAYRQRLDNVGKAIEAL